MPIYEMQGPDGKVYEIESDKEPTPEQVRQAFDAITPKEPVEAGSGGRFAEAALEQINPVNIARGVGQIIAHPIDTAAAAGQQLGDEWSRGLDLAAHGEVSRGIGHTLAGTLPLVGPAAAQAGERIASGDVAGGLGSAAGMLIAAAIPGTAARGLKALGRGAAGAAPEFAKLAGDIAETGVGAAKKVGVAPLVEAAKAGGKALYEGRGVVGASMRAAEAGVKTVLKPAIKAKIDHAVARGLKVAAEETTEVAPKAAKAAKAAAQAMNKVETIGLAEQMKAHILKVRDETWIKDPKGLAEQLHVKFKDQVQGLTPGKARQFVDAVLEDAPKAPKGTATDQMVDFVVKQAKETGGSRAQIAASLREMHPDLLTDSSARKVVDTTLDALKLTPKNTTAEEAARAGLTMNDQIRAAQARVGAP